MRRFIGHVRTHLGQYISLLDTLPSFLANISVYWARCSHSWPISAFIGHVYSHSWPIYSFIGHVALNLGQYIRLLDTLPSILANIPYKRYTKKPDSTLSQVSTFILY